MSYRISGIELTQEDITTIIDLTDIATNNYIKSGQQLKYSGRHINAAKYLRNKYWATPPDESPSLRDLYLLCLEIWQDHKTEIPEDAFMYG
jgi:hypothetical protein